MGLIRIQGYIRRSPASMKSSSTALRPFAMIGKFPGNEVFSGFAEFGEFSIFNSINCLCSNRAEFAGGEVPHQYLPVAPAFSVHGLYIKFAPSLMMPRVQGWHCRRYHGQRRCVPVPKRSCEIGCGSWVMGAGARRHRSGSVESGVVTHGCPCVGTGPEAPISKSTWSRINDSQPPLLPPLECRFRCWGAPAKSVKYFEGFLGVEHGSERDSDAGFPTVGDLPGLIFQQTNRFQNMTTVIQQVASGLCEDGSTSWRTNRLTPSFSSSD